jgi:hypothetical protein
MQLLQGSLADARALAPLAEEVSSTTLSLVNIWRHNINKLTTARTIVLVFSLIALATPSQAAQKTQARDNGASLEQKCHELVGKEEREGEGRAHIGQFQVQRFSDCMMGMPH